MFRKTEGAREGGRNLANYIFRSFQCHLLGQHSITY